MISLTVSGSQGTIRPGSAGAPGDIFISSPFSHKHPSGTTCTQPRGEWVSFIGAGWDTQVREHLPGQPGGLGRVFRRSILVQRGHTHNGWPSFAGHGPQNLLLPPPLPYPPGPSHLLIFTYSGSEVHSQEERSCCALCIGEKAGQRQGWASRPFSPLPSDFRKAAQPTKGMENSHPPASSPPACLLEG